MKSGKETLREKAVRRISAELELPAPLARSRITLSSAEGITVCGVEAIRAYDSGQITLQLAKNTLRLVGEGMTVGLYDNGTAVIHGELLGLELTEGGPLRC